MRRFFLVLVLSSVAFGQTILRWDLGGPVAGVLTIATNPPTSAGEVPSYLVVVGAVSMNWCHYPANSTQGSPCTNYATTYTDLTGGTPCASTQPIVLQGTSVCRSNSDAFGNVGVNTTAGTFAYTLTSGSTTFGPFIVTLGGGSGIPNPNANGIVVCSGTNCSTSQTTTITGTAGDITVTNGNGVAGAPTLDLPNTAVIPGSYSNVDLTVDAKGRITAAVNGTALQINGSTLTPGDLVNFNAATPASPTNGLNVTFATSNAGGVDRVSAALVGDGNASHCYLGTGVFGTCGSASGVTGSGTGQKIPLWAGAGASTSLTDSTISFSGGTYTIAGSNSLTVGGNVSILSKIPSYNGDTALVGNGIVAVTGITSLAGGKGANLGSTSLYTVGGNNSGEMYRVSCYLVINQAATSSSTLPACVVSWTDLTTGGVLTNTFTSTSTANTVGTFAGASFPFWPQSATAISVSTTGYLSSGVTPMNYGYIFMLEKP